MAAGSPAAAATRRDVRAGVAILRYAGAGALPCRVSRGATGSGGKCRRDAALILPVVGDGDRPGLRCLAPGVVWAEVGDGARVDLDTGAAGGTGQAADGADNRAVNVDE